MKPRAIVAALLADATGRLLIGQRPAHKSHPGQWEFPGGKVEAGEGEARALARELDEELGIGAEIGSLAARVRHCYADGRELEIAFYWISSYAGRIENRVFQAIAWAAAGELEGFDFLAADRDVIARLASGALVAPKLREK